MRKTMVSRYCIIPPVSWVAGRMTTERCDIARDIIIERCCSILAARFSALDSQGLVG